MGVWMYELIRYFPYMYALMTVEQDVINLEYYKKINIKGYLPEMKEQIKNKYISILRMKDKNCNTYIINELNELEKRDILKEYKDVLIYHFVNLIMNDKENTIILNELLEFESELIEKFQRYKP